MRGLRAAPAAARATTSNTRPPTHPSLSCPHPPSLRLVSRESISSMKMTDGCFRVATRNRAVTWGGQKGGGVRGSCQGEATGAHRYEYAYILSAAQCGA